jgi:integrase/recombinase XerD
MENGPGRVRMSGPLASYADSFAASLVEQGYRPDTVALYLRSMAYVSRWLLAEGLTASALDAATTDAIVAGRRSAGYPSRLRGSMRPLLDHLRAVGVAPAAEPAATTLVDALLTRHAGYLARERGLAEATIRWNVDVARAFLVRRQCGAQLELETLTAGEVASFVLEMSRRQPNSVSRVVTALRSLLRFLHLDGVVGAGLSDAVPRVARRRLAGVPKTLTSEQVAALLACCDQATAVGRRDQAILTMLSRLGLRAGEVARLRLDDVDWRRGEITVVGKGSRHERLPLPADVGALVVAYLTSGRPDTAAREVFVRARAPHRAISPGGVSTVVARAARKAGLGVVGAHRLRYSAATAMLSSGASLAEIGQVLRHVDPQTTAAYAKVDVEALRTVARTWPTPRQAAP